MDEIAGCGGHPEDGDWVAEQQKSVGAGAFGAGEPVGEQDEHRREDEAFGGSEKEPVECQQPEVADDACERGENTPTDEGEEDQAASAAPAGVGCAGNLEEEVSKEEKSAEQRGARVADVEGLGQPCCGAEAIVRAVDIGEAVGDKDSGQDVEPALAQLGLSPDCFRKRVADRDLCGALHLGDVPCCLKTKVRPMLSESAGWCLTGTKVFATKTTLGIVFLSYCLDAEK